MAIRTGDIVLHKPSGETWLVAYVEGEYLAWCGWPEGEARLADCELLHACTDEHHWDLVQELAIEGRYLPAQEIIAGVGGKRARWARWYLAQHAPQEAA